MTTTQLILASKSKGRTDMMRGAGLRFENHPADLNEAALIAKLQTQNASPQQIVNALAREKALAISLQHPKALVIGSDQVMNFNNRLMGKAKNAEQAIDRLKSMRGKAHHLISAVCVAQAGTVRWATDDQAVLTMHHNLDDAFFNAYKKRAAQALTSSVGGYWLEDVGSWLFSAIEGNYFTILGMPLLPLLTYLRNEHGITHD